MNSLSGSTTTSSVEPTRRSRPASTIRSVPAEQAPLPSNSQNRTDPPAMPHNTRDYSPAPSNTTLPRSHSNSTGLSVANGVVRRISSEFGHTRTSTTSTNQIHVPEEATAAVLHYNTTSEATDSNESNGASTLNGNSNPSSVTSPSNPSTNTQQWSTAVGRSTLGKSGRVIEKLQNQLDTMRRELTSEKANTVEYRNAVGLAETKLEKMREDHDIALHDAAIAKTSLKRRERQVAEMKAQIESEKLRADKAAEREKEWKSQMDKIQEESKIKVEEAQLHVALQDGRVETMKAHWKGQKDQVDRTVTKLRTEINRITEERRGDYERMNMLQGLCDQQAEQLTILQAEKEAIEQKFEEYKLEQEKALKDIMDKAKSQVEENEAKLQETQEVLGQLKWALNLEKNAPNLR